MKRGLVILLILVIMPIALADTKIHEDWHNYQSSFLIGDKITEVRVQPSNHDLIRVDVEQEGALVELNHCRTSIHYRFCYLEQDYDQGDIGPQGILFPGVKVSIYELEEPKGASSAEFTYDFNYELKVNSSQFDPGQEVLIESLLENLGTGPINNIRVEFHIPSNIPIVEFSQGIRRAGRTLFHTGFLTPSRTQDLSIKLKLDSVTEVNIPYKIYYDSPNRTLKEGKLVFTPKIDEVYEFDFKTSRTTLNLGESTDITLSLKNLIQQDIEITRLRIFTDSKIAFRNLHNLRNIRPGEFESTLTSINRDTEFKVRLTPTNQGDFNLRGVLDLKYNDIPIREEFDAKFTVSSDGLNHQVRSTKTNVVEGSRVEIIYNINNDNEVTLFENINFVMKGALNHNETIPFLRPGQSFEFKRIITIEDTIKNINISASTADKDLPSLEIDFNLIEEDFVSVQKSLSPQEVELGNTTIVQAKITNNLDEAVFIRAREVFNEELELVVGRAENEFILLAKESKDLYLYRLEVPLDYPYDTAFIDTVIEIPSLDYNAIFGSELTVLGENQTPFTGVLNYGFDEESEDIDEEVTGSIGEETQENFEEEQQEEDSETSNVQEDFEEEQTNPNLFERFFNWVRGII